VPASAFYRADGLAPLAKASDEIVAEVLLPETEGVRSTYLKLRARGSIDFPALGVAVAVQLAEDGTCTDARIVLGAVAPAPLSAVHAERILVGRPLTEDAVSEAAAAAARLAKPLRNADLGHGYRKRMIPVYVKRALEELASAPVSAS
jgi:CO/xanthine dehydrogenase FAD-binding subunit